MQSDSLASLLAAGPPLGVTAWSLTDAPLARAVAEVEAGARTIVECGSGRSTVVLARQLARLGEGSVHSLEHDQAWAASTKAALAREELDRAHVITAPLELGGWYSASAVAELPTGIELLLIDGPPAGEPELRRSRHHALAYLSPLLAPGAAILLDDAERKGEREAIELWEREYGLRFEHSHEAGFAVARWHL